MEHKGSSPSCSWERWDKKIVLIACAIVEIENDTNRDSFVRLLSSNLVLGDGKNIAIISDKNKVSVI